MSVAIEAFKCTDEPTFNTSTGTWSFNITECQHQLSPNQDILGKGVDIQYPASADLQVRISIYLQIGLAILLACLVPTDEPSKETARKCIFTILAILLATKFGHVENGLL